MTFRLLIGVALAALVSLVLAAGPAVADCLPLPNWPHC